MREKVNKNEVTLKEHFTEKTKTIEDRMDRLEEKFDEKFDNLEESFNEKLGNLNENILLHFKNIQVTLDQTLEQTKKTNGRVNKHDEQLENINKIHYNCPGSEALKDIENTKKEEIDALKKRLLGVEKSIEIISFAENHPKLTKIFVFAIVVLILMFATKISIDMIPDLFKLIK
jgi:transketolase